MNLVVVYFNEPMYDRNLMERLMLYSRDYNWIMGHYAELVKEYPRMYIAVRNKKVLYHVETMKKLIDRMKAKSEDPSGFAVAFLTEEKCSFLF